MSTSENIASIYIEAILDARKLREQIKDLENQKFELNIKVNDKSLTDLNNHFDKKLSHYKQLERYFGNNPLTVLVNDSQLTELNKQLSEIQNIKNIKIGIEADSLSSLNAEIEESLKKAGDNLKNIISAPFKSIGSGFFEGIGNTFGNQIGLGLNKTLKKDLNFNLQDFTNKTTSKVTNSFRNNPQPKQEPLKIPLNIPMTEKVMSEDLIGNIRNSRRLAEGIINKNIGKVIRQSFLMVEKELTKVNPDLENAKSQFENIRNKFSEAYKSLQENIKSNNLELAEIYAAQIISLGDKAKSDIDNIKKSLKNSGVDDSFGSELSTVAGSTKGVIESRYIKPSKRELTKLEQFKEQGQFVDTGKNVVSGLVQGMKQTNPLVRESSEVSLIILNTMRKQLGIQSPSKRAFEIAKNIGLGLIEGLKNASTSVGKAASDLAENALPNLKTKSISQQKAEIRKRKDVLNNSKDTFGTEEYFDAMYDEFASQFRKKATKSMGKEGKGIGREAAGMGISLAAFSAPISTAASVLSPLLLPSLPTLVTGSLINNLLQPLFVKIGDAMRQTSPIQQRLNNLSGSERLGNQEMSYLQNVSGRFDTSISAGSDAYSQLSFATKGTKLEGDNTKKLFEGISAASRFVGASVYDTSLIFQAFTQMIAKGRVSMEELRQQLGEKFPPAMQVFAKALGVSVPEMGSLIQKGAVLSEDVLPKVADVLLNQFSKATDSAATRFVSATTRMENAGFNLNLKISKAFGNMFSGVIGLFANFVDYFSSNFETITKVGTAALIGMTAQVAIGLQTILASAPIASKLSMVQNFFLSSFKKSFSLLTPFLAGTFVDILDDFLGAKNSVMENMSKGFVQIFTGMFSGLDNISRGMGNKPLFNINLTTEDVDIISDLKSNLSGFFKIIPSGIVEMGALMMMFQQTTVLAGMYLVPTFKSVGGALIDMGKAFVGGIANTKNLKDSLAGIFPLIARNAGNILKQLSGLALNAVAALGVMAFAQSDFGNPLQKGFNDVASSIKNNLKDIKIGLKQLSDTSKEVGKNIKESLELPSKGLELNPLKILGISDETTSFKSDDFFKGVNRDTDKNSLSDSEKKLAQQTKKQADSLGLERFFTGNERYFTEGQKQLLNFGADVKEQAKQLETVLSGMKLTPDKVGSLISSDEMQKNIEQLKEFDNQIKDLSSKRADIALKNTSEGKKEIRELDKEIDSLVKERGQKVKPLSSILGNIDELKENLNKQKKVIDDANIPESAKKSLKVLLEPQEKMIEGTVKALKDAKLYQLVKPLEDIWTRVIDKLRDVDVAINKFTDNFKIENTNKQANLINQTGLMSDGNIKRQSDLGNIQSLKTQQSVLTKTSTFRENSLRELLSISGVENTDARKEEIKKLREQIEKDKLQIAENNLQIAQSSASLIKEMREQTKQVNEYFLGISRQVQEANLEFQRQTNTLKANSASSKIRKAIGYTEDSFLNSFVEGLIQEIEATNAIANEELNRKSKVLSNKSQLQDAVKQAGELSLSLPGGKIPSVPVELNFEGVDNNFNVNLLKNSFSDVQGKVDDITTATLNLDNGIKDNINSSSQITEEFNKSFDNILKVTTETANTGNQVNDVKEKVNLVNQEIQKTSDITNKVTNETNILSQAWNGLVNWISQALSATQLWFNKLLEGNEILKGIGNTFNSLVQNSGNFIQQGINNLQQAAQSDANQIVGAMSGNQYGIASPSTTQNLKQVLGGNVSQGQGFFGRRDRGNHASIDFDKTEGLGGLAQFNAMFPGVVTSLRQWGGGTTDKESGKESNALRVKSKLPGMNDFFYTDYGHYLKESAQVKEGQNIGAGQRLGQLSKDDNWSQGGHLDLKIRIPNSIANQFKTKLVDPKSRNMSFVEVKEFMNWYQSQLGKVPQSQNNQGEPPPLTVNVPDNATNRKTFRESPRNNNQFSVPVNGIKRGGNDLSPQEYSKLTPLGKRLYEHRNNPNLLATWDTVARAEGTDFRSNSKNFGYSMIIGGEHDTDFSRHPFAGNQGTRIRNPKQIAPGLASTAAGRGQNMDFNYSKNRVQQQFGNGSQSLAGMIFQGENPGSFSPAVQDLLFTASLYQRKALDDALTGNFEKVFSNKGVAQHYASLQAGSAKSAHRGQGTPEGQFKNTVSFAQQRAGARQSGNIQTQQTPINQTYSSPQQLQSKVSQGLNLQTQSIKQNDELVKKQSEAEIQRQRDTIIRNSESQLAGLRKNLQDNQDTRLSTTRRTQDLRDNSKPIKSTSEEFLIKIQGINREYDDIILELTRKSETINKSLDKSKKLLVSGNVTGENKTILERKIKDDEKTLGTITKELENVKKLRTQSTNEAKRVFNREEFIRQQNITFEESSKQIGVLKAQLEGLQTLQQSNPLDERSLAIPGMQREITLLETNLELNQEIAKIEERRFKKELTDTQAENQIQRQREINEEKIKGIELTFNQADADVKLKRQSLELDKRARFSESENSILQERIKAVELAESRNPLAVNPYEKIFNQERLQVSQLGLDSEKQIQSILEFANSIKLPEEQTRKLIGNVETLNNLKLDNIKTEFDNLRLDAGIKRLEDINSRENQLAEFNNKNAFSREQMEIDKYKTNGGNEFVANDRSRRLGRVQEFVRFEQEQREFEIKTQRMKQAGFSIPDDSLTKIKEDMQAIHNLNLDNINQQFKTFGQTLNDIGKNSIQGLSQGITGLIMGTQNLNDVLDNFFNNILSQVLNTGLQSLLGGLLGGGGFLGGLFYDGGIVPRYATGGLRDGFKKERSESGRNPQLAIVHDGELIIPYKRTMQLAKRGLSPDMLLGRFADGGIVGNKDINSLVGRTSENKEIKVESTVINSVEYVTIDQFKQGIKQAAKSGAEGGLSMVQSKMSGSVSWRNSVGLQ